MRILQDNQDLPKGQGKGLGTCVVHPNVYKYRHAVPSYYCSDIITLISSCLSSDTIIQKTKTPIGHTYIQTNIHPPMQPTNTLHTFAPVNMPNNPHTYAASTFSEATTTYSYDKTPVEQSKTTTTGKRSLKQRVKSVFKDMGTNPFEYDQDQDKPANWVSKLPPSRT